MLNFGQGGVLTGYNGAAYLKCSLSHTERKSEVGQKYFLIISPALCFILLTRWIHSAFLEKTWIYSEAHLEPSFSPMEITQTPWMLTKESLPTIILPFSFVINPAVFLYVSPLFQYLSCPILLFLCFLLLSSFGCSPAAWQPSAHSTCLLSLRGISPNADFSHSRSIIPVVVIRTHLTPRIFRVILLHILNTAPPFLPFPLSFSGDVPMILSCCAATC